jgi:hypothetical protein
VPERDTQLRGSCSAESGNPTNAKKLRKCENTFFYTHGSAAYQKRSSARPQASQSEAYLLRTPRTHDAAAEVVSDTHQKRASSRCRWWNQFRKMSGYKFMHRIFNGVTDDMLCDVRERRVLGCCRRALLRNAPASSAGQHATFMYIIQLEMQHSCLALRPTCCTVAASTALHNSRTYATHAYAIDMPSLVSRTRSCRACWPVESTCRQCGCSTALLPIASSKPPQVKRSRPHASEMPRSCFSLAHAPHESSPGGRYTYDQQQQ